jgi:hypothetical protein
VLKIEQYFEVANDQILFSRQQSSEFAKRVAGDFNPLHDVDAKRFCVPGDLLFAVYLHRHGVFDSMHFDFMAMVDAGVPLTEQRDGQEVVLIDEKGRSYLGVRTEGTQSGADDLIGGLTQAYVEFSGQTFPYLLVDLMRENDVMINPSRPLVIYKSMQLTMSRLVGKDISLHFSGADLQSEGKKATVGLNFDIHASGEQIGQGQKQMVLGGLRAFDQVVMDELVSEYQAIKQKFSERAVL